MKITNKLKKWVEQGFISQKQAEKIMLSEQTKHSDLTWKLMYWIAGLFIGLGCILIIGSNWNNIPALVKLVGNYIVLAGVLYGAYWSLTNKKDNSKELFLTLSFLFVGATIGHVAQIFNLNGGWHSFAIMWSILSIGLIIFSKLIILNIVWLCLFFSAVDWENLFQWLDHFIRGELSALIILTTVFALLTYISNKVYKSIHQVIVLPKAFAVFCLVIMYFVAVILGAIIGFENIFANIFVFVFLGVRLLVAIRHKDIKSFIRNTHLTELYILFLFITRFGNLFMSGIGFIVGGVLLLGILYLLKKTSKYIKTMEVFHV